MVGQEGRGFNLAPGYAQIHLAKDSLLLMCLYADTGESVFMPFRMSCYVLSNLVVTAGMLTPGLGVSAILF